MDPQGRRYKPTKQCVILSFLQEAIHRTFHTYTKLLTNPLVCFMTEKITYRKAFPEDSAIGVLQNALGYRWTGSCIAKLVY
jgi:hypothetical protein